VVECADRVDAHGAPRGKPSGQQRHGDYGGGGERQAGGVGRLDAEEECTDDPFQRKRGRDADREPHTRDHTNLREKHAQYARPACAQGDADADLAGAVGHGVGNEPVQSHAGEGQGDGSEQRNQEGSQALSKEGLVDLRLQAFDVYQLFLSATIDAIRSLKLLFDPKVRLNLGKLLPAGWGCLEIRRWAGAEV